MNKLSLILVLIFILTSGFTSLEATFPQKKPLFREIFRPFQTISPELKRIDFLPRELKQTEVDRILEQQSGKGPLLESDPLDGQMIFVTFFLRCPQKQQDVRIEIFGMYDDTCLDDKKLRRIEPTDVWTQSYKFPVDVCFSYRFNLLDKKGPEKNVIDALNTNRVPHGTEQSLSWSVLDLECPDERYNRFRPDIAHGQSLDVPFYSNYLKNERIITFYLPPGYDRNRPKAYPMILLFDGFIYQNRVETAHILDNLISEKKIEPAIAVMVNQFSQKTRMIELAFYPPYTQFLLKELLPFIRKHYHVSDDPGENIIGGISYGGLTATAFAFEYPELFGNVLGESSSYWRSDLIKMDGSIPWVRTDHLIERFIKGPRSPIKFFLDWGLFDGMVRDSNRRMARVMMQKGYELKYEEFSGWHDWSNSRKTFVRGLLYLWGKR